jgi:hypothetical protein
MPSDYEIEVLKALQEISEELRALGIDLEELNDRLKEIEYVLRPK